MSTDPYAHMTDEELERYGRDLLGIPEPEDETITLSEFGGLLKVGVLAGLGVTGFMALVAYLASRLLSLAPQVVMYASVTR